MKSSSIETWWRDGLIIVSRYQQKIAEEGINSAKSLGERTSEKDWEFYSLLFEKVSLKRSISILDIGCGKAELLAFLKNNYSEIKIDRYLGLDLVEEFLDVARLNHPEYEFRLENFISDRFLPRQPREKYWTK
ncbi:MAG: class I SAM-dependent methyltransferase [Xenococcaceae cyanobacterium]